LKQETAKSASDAIAALEATIAELKEITSQHGIKEPAHLNVVLTEGNWLVASRYVTDPALTPPTLYHSEGSRFDCEDGVCRMHRVDPAEHAVLIVSEKLTEVQEDWHKVPPNHVVMVSADLAVSVSPIRK
jgi:glutamine amidotransferase